MRVNLNNNSFSDFTLNQSYKLTFPSKSLNINKNNTLLNSFNLNNISRITFNNTILTDLDNDYYKDDFIVYPNPIVDNEFNITSKYWVKNIQSLEIYDAFGKLILIMNNFHGVDEQNINIKLTNSIKSGLFEVVLISNEGLIQTIKISKI